MERGILTDRNFNRLNQLKQAEIYWSSWRSWKEIIYDSMPRSLILFMIQRQTLFKKVYDSNHNNKSK